MIENYTLKLLCILLGCMVCLRTEECLQRVYIDKSYNQSCIVVPKTTNDWHCASLDNAFRDLKSINRTCIYLNSNTNIENTRTLEYVYSLSISSISNNSSLSSITCKENTALRFKHCSNIQLSLLTFHGCGDIFEIEWNDEFYEINKKKSLNVSVAITFERCTIVNISDVELKSSNGYALLFKDTNYAKVNRASIVDSRYAYVKYENETFEIGGGIFVYYHDSDAGNNNHFDVCDSDITTTRSVSKLVVVSPSPDHLPYGKGGGIHLSVSQKLTGNSIRIERTKIMNNSANNGAGVFVRLQKHSRYNHVTLDGCILINNTAKQIGGGFYARVYAETNNSVIMSRSRIIGNQANVGGGISLISMQFNSVGNNRTYQLHELTLSNNKAQLGTAMHLSLIHI